MSGDTTIRRGKAKITITGMTELFAKLNKLGDNAEKAAIEVFDEAAQEVYSKSQSLVPTDTAALKTSGRVSKARVSKKGVVTASVNYGGGPMERLTGRPNDLHAIVVHEDLSLKHDDGQAKFLEQPMVAARGSVLQRLSRRIMDRIAQG